MNRRAFLKRAGLIAAAVVVAPKVLTGKPAVETLTPKYKHKAYSMGFIVDKTEAPGRGIFGQPGT